MLSPGIGFKHGTNRPIEDDAIAFGVLRDEACGIRTLERDRLVMVGCPFRGWRGSVE